jgi:chromosomal replication initiator protein
VLLVDDVHVLAGRERTQEEFFYTFNALHAAQKQIVLTSDKFPQEISGLEERLRSRFQWGLIADIKAPELETRVAILKRKAERDRIDLPDEIAFFLAQNIWRNVRALEGALIQLAAYASLPGRPLPPGLARAALRYLLESQDKALTVESIQKLVAEHFDVKVADLRGQRRHRVIAHPRSIAMYLCRKHTQASFPQIGERFGGKDHSTVIAAVRKVEKAIGADPAIRNEVEALERKLPR